MPAFTEVLASAEEAEETVAEDHMHGITDGRFRVPTRELMEDNQLRESSLHAEIERLSAESVSEESDEPISWQQKLATKLQDEEIVADEDERELAMHRQSLVVLKKMLAQTQDAMKHTKHRLMIKEIAKEVMAQIKKQQDEALTVRSPFQQLYRTKDRPLPRSH